MASESSFVPRVSAVIVFAVILGGRMYWDDMFSKQPTHTRHYVKSFAFCIVVWLAMSNLNRMRTSCKEATLSMPWLNRTVVVKEVFWNYLQAALMEPMVAIATEAIDFHKGPSSSILFLKDSCVHILMLLSLLWWTYIITDAFDESDTEQEFKFRGFAKDLQDRRRARTLADASEWLTTEDTEQSVGHMGSWSHDLALWWVLTVIGFAGFGVVKHTDVWHAYVLLILWCVLHHFIYRATSWGANYLVSLLIPSSALLPVQFCLLLRAAGSLEDLEERREFVRGRCGVHLRIKTQVVHASTNPKDS